MALIPPDHQRDPSEKNPGTHRATLRQILDKEEDVSGWIDIPEGTLETVTLFFQAFGDISWGIMDTQSEGVNNLRIIMESAPYKGFADGLRGKDPHPGEGDCARDYATGHQYGKAYQKPADTGSADQVGNHPSTRHL
ncbi:MAG: hypothetical protein ABIH34_05215 [Nanoarchaeota archaeon]